MGSKRITALYLAAVGPAALVVVLGIGIAVGSNSAVGQLGSPPEKQLPAALPDKGIWPEFDEKISIQLPTGLPLDHIRLVVDKAARLLTVMAGKTAVITYPAALGATPGGHTQLPGDKRLPDGTDGAGTSYRVALRDGDARELYSVVKNDTPTLVTAHRRQYYGDLDRDGIPNQVDGLLGAKKAVENGASYDGRYIRIPYPKGDVPRELGVCTDVIVRALRNAGLDLQEAIQHDRAKRPKAYSRISEPNPSIDHRRVKNLIPWFKRHWQSLPVALEQGNYLPGDVVFFDTLPAKGADHVGMVSDRTGPSGYPLIINNWTKGSHTTEMDLLAFVPVTGHYRWPAVD